MGNEEMWLTRGRVWVVGGYTILPGKSVCHPHRRRRGPLWKAHQDTQWLMTYLKTCRLFLSSGKIFPPIINPI